MLVIKMRALAVLVATLCALPSPAAAECESYWSALHGKDEQQVLRLPNGFPLRQFTDSEPMLEPGVSGTGSSTLSWVPRTSPASVKLVGQLDGRHVQVVRYSARSVTILIEQGLLFCPAFILDADTGYSDMDVVAFTGTPEIFSWHGTNLLSVRVYIKGNGTIQESFFFRMVDAQLVHLEQEPVTEDSIPDGWVQSSHGGGFCRDSLVWQVATGGDSLKQGVIRRLFKIEGRRLRLESTVGIPQGQPLDPCDPYYELRKPG